MVFERIKKHDKKIRQKMTPSQIVIFGFFLIVLSGAILLTFPISSRSGQWTSFLTCLFTATSSTCVTGLVVVDTYTYWSLFGQLVILLLIQTGGLGFMTIGVMVAMFFKKNIGIRERTILLESMNTMQIGGIIKFLKRIMKATFFIEGTGAVILAIRFIPEFGFWEGLYYGIFHSISAFCNAGFDLMGRFGEYSSLTPYAGDVTINITLDILIVVGGLGFVVWDDIYNNKFHWKKYMLHTKIVLFTTAILLVGGTALFLLLEKDNLFAGQSFGLNFMEALFSAITPRTAGFNTVDTGLLTDSSKFLTIILMLIGGSPGSTAGGIKTTTIAVIVISVFSYLRNNSGSNVFGRRLKQEAVRKASIIISIDLLLGVAATLVLSACQDSSFIDILFEVFSAIGTAGMSCGITRDLIPLSRVIIMILMFCGRVGSMTFAIMFLQKKNVPVVKEPEESILLG